LRRFLNLLGGYTYSKNTYSYAAAEVIIPHVLGNFYNFLFDTTSWDSITDNTSLFLAFGGIPLKNGQISQGGVGSHIQKDYLNKAALKGVKFINLSPLKADLEAEGHTKWIPIKPNTDVALMLALCYELNRAGMTNKGFIDKYTVGFEKFIGYLNGLSDGIIKSADWASNIIGINKKAIFDLVEDIHKSERTMLSVSWSLTRQSHGEQPYWAAIALASIIGDIGKPGGGIGFGYSAMNSIGNHYNKIPAVSLPLGQNSIRKFIPVARISEMLERPGTSFDYNGSKLTYPDIL
jgi:biotin/methionine sulfoxide reductase